MFYKTPAVEAKSQIFIFLSLYLVNSINTNVSYFYSEDMFLHAKKQFFNTVLNKLFHIINVYIYYTGQNN